VSPDAASRQDKVALVTGASRGIGRAIANRLVADGVAVVMNGRDKQVLDEAVEQVGRLGGRAIAVAGSISDADLPERLVATAFDAFGGLDYIVNNAATSSHYGPLLRVERDAFAKTMLANTWPALAIVQTAVTHGMRDGAVVNISTTGAQRVHPVTAPYCASKAALEALTAALARELGPLGIRVNAVAPGLVKTDLARVLWKGDRGVAETRLVPLGRLGEADDIAAAVQFLLGDQSRWITGATLRVDGGRFHVGGEPADLIGVF
jgi:3-oxoacyl-[acyl-carrier protein] reductase